MYNKFTKIIYTLIWEKVDFNLLFLTASLETP